MSMNQKMSEKPYAYVSRKARNKNMRNKLKRREKNGY
jgi:hypothetical protein